MLFFQCKKNDDIDHELMEKEGEREKIVKLEVKCNEREEKSQRDDDDNE